MMEVVLRGEVDRRELLPKDCFLGKKNWIPTPYIPKRFAWKPLHKFKDGGSWSDFERHGPIAAFEHKR